MAGLARKDNRWAFPDLMEWIESGAPFMPWRTATGPHPLRVEELARDGAFVVRAELPGIDPAKDVEITLSDGMLRIHAERGEEHTDKTRSEFRYGVFLREIQLPAGARPEEVSASYRDGILTVTVPLGEIKDSARKVPVTKE